MNDYNYIFSKNISTLFYLGFFSKMPGTLGSLAGLITGFLLIKYFSIIIFYFFFFIIFLTSFNVVRIYQKKVGETDKSEIIIDEYVGQLIPLIYFHHSYKDFLIAFLFFRIFDIIKIFPANIIDRKYSNYFGVIFDDVIAGIQTLILMLTLRYYNVFLL